MCMLIINGMKVTWILLQVVFFILLFCIERTFDAHRNIKVVLGLLLVLWISFVMCKYILRSDKMIYTSFLMGLFLCFLFEISKYIKHLFGFLPYYGDVPIVISILISVLAVFVYMSILYAICLLWKRHI